MNVEALSETDRLKLTVVDGRTDHVGAGSLVDERRRFLDREQTNLAHWRTSAHST